MYRMCCEAAFMSEAYDLTAMRHVKCALNQAGCPQILSKNPFKRRKTIVLFLKKV